MVLADILLNGMEDALNLVETLEMFVSRSEIGTVYSRGAGARRYEWDVMGAGTQAPIHRGRWQTDESIAKDQLPTAMVFVGQAIGDVVVGGTGSRYLTSLLDSIYRAATDYPPPPPGSRYVRTYTLQGSWVMKPAF